jgi:hypothetical protein
MMDVAGADNLFEARVFQDLVFRGESVNLLRSAFSLVLQALTSPAFTKGRRLDGIVQVFLKSLSKKA